MSLLHAPISKVVHRNRRIRHQEICSEFDHRRNSRRRFKQNGPAIIHSLDVESQRGFDGVDLLAIKLFDDCRLARIIKPSATLHTLSIGEEDCRSKQDFLGVGILHHQDTHLALLLADLLQNRE